MTELLEMFPALANSLYKPQKLPGLQLADWLITSKGKTLFIHKGDLVKVENGKLVHCDPDPSHELLYVVGSMCPPYSIVLKNLETELEETITLY